MKKSNQKKSDKTFLPLVNTMLLAVIIVLVPVLIGILLVMGVKQWKQDSSSGADEAIAVMQQEETGTTIAEPDKPLLRAELIELRRKMREQGHSLDEVNLKLWAQTQIEPIILLSITPPAWQGGCQWYLTTAGLHAVAVAMEPDENQQRKIALYNLITHKWEWQTELQIPATLAEPHLLRKNLFLRYALNSRLFDIELDDKGQVVNFKPHGSGTITPPLWSPPVSAYKGKLLSVKNNLIFTEDPVSGALTAYPIYDTPALVSAGSVSEYLTFSGNGLLKFTAHQGTVNVYDALTLTKLQEIKAWKHQPATTLKGLTATLNGSKLLLHLVTKYPEQADQGQAWQVEIDIYHNTQQILFNPISPPPELCVEKRALSHNNHWLFSLNPVQQLTLAKAGQAESDQAKAVWHSPASTPIKGIEWLANHCHLLIRSENNLILLDFNTALAYGDLLAKVSALHTDHNQPQPKSVTPENHKLLYPAHGRQPVSTSSVSDPRLDPKVEAGVSSSLALQSEWFAAHQAWGHAAALLQTASDMQSHDRRSPQINMFMLARFYMLAGKVAESRQAARLAMESLSSDDENTRMIRYHLQGLYFAE